ncbi:MAG: dipeptidase [Polyangiaceae bacterium]|nr:dipeptidase [Polyangiaceae bacterium]
MSQRFMFLMGLCVLGVLFLVAPQLNAGEPTPGVIDLHVDISYRSLYQGKAFTEGSGQFRAGDLRAGGISGVVLPLYVPLDAEPEGRGEFQLERSYAHVFSSILAAPPYSLPGCGIHRAGGQVRRVETWLAFEGIGSLPTDEATLRNWMVRGLRIFGLIHTHHNRIGTSSGHRAHGRGLSASGRETVERIFSLGGVVDISHSGDETTDSVLSIAEEQGGVVVATHSNARALAPHPRNLTDQQIRRIAATGGVVGVNFHQRFLQPADGRASLKDVVDQILYLKKVGGLSLVAIGSDYEGGIRPAQGLENAGKFPALAEALREAGLGEDALGQVFGQNARRVLCRR